ncbi:tyrosine-type recombinase/integrase [Streptomyces sp. NPDC101225]|uniref:tyrosine-type recombinase/integrase n=1 Tax=Streptomyces sp. NPDC101225 TaxID=3366135 RepID=UPI00380D5F50
MRLPRQPPPPTRSTLPRLLTDHHHGTWTFAVDIPAPHHRRTTVRRGGFTSHDAAQAALRTFLEGEAGGFNADPNQTVADYLHAWLTAKALVLKPTTMARYRDYVHNDLVPAFGSLHLDDLRHRHISAFVSSQLAAGRGRTHSNPSAPFTGLVFCRRDGRPLRPSAVLNRLRELSDEAGVPRVTVHDLRHLAATVTITAGVPLTVVSKTLRHSTLSTTANIYSHLTQQAAREAVDTIEHTLTLAEQRADRQARPKQLRPPRDHIRRLREALHRLRSPAPPSFCAVANESRTRPATTLRPPAPRERERPPSRKRENGLRPASKLVGTTGFEPATP